MTIATRFRASALVLTLSTIALIGIFAQRATAAINGDAAPCRTISGTAAKIDAPMGVAIGARGEIIVVSGSGRIGFFDAKAKADIAPLRTIEGPATKLARPSALAVDAHGNIYVGQVGAVLVFAPRAMGNAAPMRAIRLKNDWTRVLALAMTSNGDLLVGTDFNEWLRFGPDANGDATPLFDSSPATSEKYAIAGIAVDSTGAMYVGIAGFDAPVGGWVNSFVMIFPGKVSDRGGPAHEITFPERGPLKALNAMALDAKETLWVINREANAVGGFSPSSVPSNGLMVKPTHLIIGPHTRLSAPTAIAVDPEGNLYVTNYAGSNVTVYCRARPTLK